MQRFLKASLCIISIYKLLNPLLYFPPPPFKFFSYEANSTACLSELKDGFKSTSLFYSSLWSVPLISRESPEGPTVKPTNSKETCPGDTLKLRACANMLNLAKNLVGEKERAACCSLIDGLVDLEAAVCLCTRVRADLLGLIKLDIPVAVEVLLNECNSKVAKIFKCPSN